MNRSKTLLAAGLAAAMVATAAQAQTAASQNAASNAAPPAVKAVTMMASAVPSSDLDKSIAFYTKGLGMTSAGRLEMAQVTEAPLMFPGGGAYLMLVKPKAEGTPLQARGASSRVVLAVPDVKALEAQLTAAGYHLNGPIFEEAQYHVAVGMVQDPDGNFVELVQRTP